MSAKSKALKMMIWQIRRVFQQLASEGNALLQGMDINASERAVLEFLYRLEPQTVPDIARKHDVSRQHIQKIVNDLLDKGLVETLQNPEHKRSVLVRRTEKGIALFDKVRMMEERLFEAMAPNFTLKNLENTRDTLQQLSTYMHSESWRQIKSALPGKGDRK